MESYDKMVAIIVGIMFGSAALLGSAYFIANAYKVTHAPTTQEARP